MSQQVYDIKLEEITKVLAKMEVTISENNKQIQELKYAYERSKGGVMAARLCAIFFLGALTWFVQDKITGYENWNRTQDSNQSQTQQQVYALETRVAKLEMSGTIKPSN